MTAGLAREPRLAEGTFLTGQVADWDKILISALPHTDYISFPGTAFSYSNIGYAILGAALSRVAGMPYTEWERTRVLTPLGMTHTRFEIDPSIATDPRDRLPSQPRRLIWTIRPRRTKVEPGAVTRCRTARSSPRSMT